MKFNTIQEQLQSGKVAELKKNSQCQQFTLTRPNAESELYVTGRYNTSGKIASKLKAIYDGEFIMECGDFSLFQKYLISESTVTIARIIRLSLGYQKCIYKGHTSRIFYSTAVNETTYMMDTA